MTDGPVVRFERVSKRFGNFVALDGLDLDVRRGEFLTLLGASGCGKTTTLRIISGFEEPSEGCVYIDGKAVNGVPAHRRQVNTVFQNYALFPHMTVGENVGYGLRFDGIGRKERRRRAAEMLARVGLAEKIEQRPDALSGGQMQRVALARALIKQPRVLLLDEPLSALDAKLRKELQLELKRIQRETGVTFVFVTHDQQEALVMSDRIAVMESGRILQLGTPGEIYDRPASSAVAAFVGDSNRLDGQVAVVGEGSLTVELASGDRLELESLEPASWKTGDLVRLFVRPESLQVSLPAGEGGATAVAAQLEDLIFLGVDRKLVVRLSDGTRLEVQERSARLPKGLEERVGEEIGLTFPADETLVFGREPGA